METLSFGDEWCEECKRLKNELNSLKTEHLLAYKQLKGKITSADILLKNYVVLQKKCQELTKCNLQLETENKVFKDKAKKVQRECELLSSELNKALQTEEPSKKAREHLEKKSRSLEAQLKDAQDSLAGRDATLRQFQNLHASSEHERAKVEKSMTDLKNKVKELEVSIKKSDATLKKTQEVVEKKKTELTEVTKENKELKKQLNKLEKQGANLIFSKRRSNTQQVSADEDDGDLVEVAVVRPPPAVSRTVNKPVSTPTMPSCTPPSGRALRSTGRVDLISRIPPEFFMPLPPPLSPIPPTPPRCKSPKKLPTSTATTPTPALVGLLTPLTPTLTASPTPAFPFSTPAETASSEEWYDDLILSDSDGDLSDVASQLDLELMDDYMEFKQETLDIQKELSIKSEDSDATINYMDNLMFKKQESSEPPDSKPQVTFEDAPWKTENQQNDTRFETRIKLSDHGGSLYEPNIQDGSGGGPSDQGGSGYDPSVQAIAECDPGVHDSCATSQYSPGVHASSSVTALQNELSHLMGGFDSAQLAQFVSDLVNQHGIYIDETHQNTQDDMEVNVGFKQEENLPTSEEYPWQESPSLQLDSGRSEQEIVEIPVKEEHAAGIDFDPKQEGVPSAVMMPEDKLQCGLSLTTSGLQTVLFSAPFDTSAAGDTTLLSPDVHIIKIEELGKVVGAPLKPPLKRGSTDELDGHREHKYLCKSDIGESGNDELNSSTSANSYQSAICTDGNLPSAVNSRRIPSVGSSPCVPANSNNQHAPAGTASLQSNTCSTPTLRSHTIEAGAAVSSASPLPRQPSLAMTHTPIIISTKKTRVGPFKPVGNRARQLKKREEQAADSVTTPVAGGKSSENDITLSTPVAGGKSSENDITLSTPVAVSMGMITDSVVTPVPVQGISTPEASQISQTPLPTNRRHITSRVSLKRPECSKSLPQNTQATVDAPQGPDEYKGLDRELQYVLKFNSLGVGEIADRVTRLNPVPDARTVVQLVIKLLGCCDTDILELVQAHPQCKQVLQCASDWQPVHSTVGEERMVDFLVILDSKMQGLCSTLMSQGVHEVHHSQDLHLRGRSSLVRVLVGVGRMQWQLWNGCIKVLLYDLMMTQPIGWTQLLLAALAIHPTAMHSTELPSIVAEVYQFVLTHSSMSERSSQTVTCCLRLAGFTPSTNTAEQLCQQLLVTLQLQALLKEQQQVYQSLRCLELLAAVNGADWTVKVMISSDLWPKIDTVLTSYLPDTENCAVSLLCALERLLFVVKGNVADLAKTLVSKLSDCCLGPISLKVSPAVQLVAMHCLILLYPYDYTQVKALAQLWWIQRRQQVPEPDKAPIEWFISKCTKT